MIKKNYRMNEEDLEVIQQVKKQHGFHSDSETLRYIVRSHIVQNQEENSKLLSILRKVEEKIDILFDIENTKLIQQEAEVLYPVSMLESPVVTKASALRKENLANKKQKADYKKQKQGNMKWLEKAVDQGNVYAEEILNDLNVRIRDMNRYGAQKGIRNNALGELDKAMVALRKSLYETQKEMRYNMMVYEQDIRAEIDGYVLEERRGLT